MSILLLFGALVTVQLAPTGATEVDESTKYIVDGNNGDDSNSGKDVDNAFKTIA